MSKAMEWYHEAAGLWNDEAQLILGLHYYNGDGVEKDFSKAVEWFRKATEWVKNAKAQYYLGVCYENGEGVERDRTTAIEWDRKAAEMGLPEARRRLQEWK